MKKSGFLFACLFLSCLIFIIAGCGGAYVDEWEVGLYSTSPDGKWAVIVEQPSTSYEQSVVLVDLESDQFARPLEGQIQTSKNVFFSPNSDFLLYLTNESWYLYNISTNSTITQTIISIDDKAFFLNDGSIAVITENKANASLGNSEETENSNEDALLFDYFSIYFVDPNNPYERSDFSRDASENTMRTIVGGEQLCLPFH